MRSSSLTPPKRCLETNERNESTKRRASEQQDPRDARTIASLHMHEESSSDIFHLSVRPSVRLSVFQPNHTTDTNRRPNNHPQKIRTPPHEQGTKKGLDRNRPGKLLDNIRTNHHSPSPKPSPKLPTTPTHTLTHPFCIQRPARRLGHVLSCFFFQHPLLFTSPPPDVTGGFGYHKVHTAQLLASPRWLHVCRHRRSAVGIQWLGGEAESGAAIVAHACRTYHGSRCCSAAAGLSCLYTSGCGRRRRLLSGAV